MTRSPIGVTFTPPPIPSSSISTLSTIIRALLRRQSTTVPGRPAGEGTWNVWDKVIFPCCRMDRGRDVLVKFGSARLPKTLTVTRTPTSTLERPRIPLHSSTSTSKVASPVVDASHSWSSSPPEPSSSDRGIFSKEWLLSSAGWTVLIDVR